MASVIDVANRALTKLGAARITSLLDDSKQARAVNSCFDDLRDAELRQNRWSFAIKRVQVAALADAPLYGFEHAYALPTDFLRLDMVGEDYPPADLADYRNSEDVDYVVEDNMVLTNLSSPLSIRYGASIADPQKWDALFREVLACRLAVELCEDLTQSSTKREFAWEEYKNAIVVARRASAVERLPASIPDDAWIFSRL